MKDLSPHRITIVHDPIAEKLDELAVLAEAWKEARKAGRCGDSVRTGLLHAVAAVEFLRQQAEHLAVVMNQEFARKRPDASKEQALR